MSLLPWPSLWPLGGTAAPEPPGRQLPGGLWQMREEQPFPWLTLSPGLQAAWVSPGISCQTASSAHNPLADLIHRQSLSSFMPVYCALLHKQFFLFPQLRNKQVSPGFETNKCLLITIILEPNKFRQLIALYHFSSYWIPVKVKLLQISILLTCIVGKKELEIYWKKNVNMLIIISKLEKSP